MKILLKNLLIIVLSGLFSNAFSQNVGVQYRLNAANIINKVGTESNGKQLNNLKMGIAAGITYNRPLIKGISFQTAFIFSSKGFKRKSDNDFLSIKLLYGLVPLTLKSTFDLNGRKFFVSAGPYLAIGLNGQRRELFNDELIEERIVFGSKIRSSAYKKTDYGAQFQIGTEFNYIHLGITYSLGTKNIAVDQSDSYTLKNQVLSLSIGVFFNQKTLELFQKINPNIEEI